MAGTRAAARYAKAILSLAKDQNTTEVVNNDMKLISKTIADNKDLKNVLKSPVVRSAIKKSILVGTFKDITPSTSNLIDTLIANKRIALLDEIAVQYNLLFDHLNDMQVAKVTTAVPMTDEIKTKVLAKVKELTGKEAEIKNIVDEDIIGGFILRVGDIQYNASIANKLNRLKREFILN